MFKNLKNTSQKKSVLIVDGSNTFIRTMAVSTITNKFGIPIGGLSGFLFSIGYAIKKFNISKCIVTFDTLTSSNYRKSIYPDYKGNRNGRTEPRNKKVFSSLEQERKSEQFQYNRLIQYLEALPVTTIISPNYEADDVISYLSKSNELSDYTKYIMSTDHDFYQLISDDIIIYNPTSKKLMDINKLKEIHGVIPSNFIHIKSVVGDNSDNIPGIKGVGEKTLRKRLPIIETATAISIDDILSEANKQSKYKAISKLIDDIDIIIRNHTLMQLHDSIIDDKYKSELSNLVQINPSQNMFQFHKLLNADGMIIFKNPTKWAHEVFRLF